MAPRDLSSFWDELVACAGRLDRLLDLIARRSAEVIGEGAVLTLVSADGGSLDPVATYHQDADIQDYMRSLLGSRPAKVGQGIAGKVAADQRPAILSDFDPAAMKALVDPTYHEFLARHPIRSLAIVPMVAHGTVVGTLGVVRTESRAPYADEDLVALEALAERAGLALADARGPAPRIGPDDYRAIFEHSPNGVLFTKPDGTILAVNPAACELLGRTAEEICQVGRDGLLFEHDPATARALRTRELTGNVRAEVPLRRRDGSVLVVDLASSIFVTTGGEPRACVIFSDATENVTMREALERKSDELSRLADYDDLTQLHNRRGLRSAAHQALAFADREEVPVQLVFLDVDGLKRINDTHGHAIGDAVLGKVGRALAAEVREVDVAARIGGDEFVALLYAASEQDAGPIVERVLDASRRTDDDLPAAHISVGIAHRPPGSDLDLDDLLREADQQMYSGRIERRALRRGARTGEDDRDARPAG